jgi:hypothetical protein
MIKDLRLHGRQSSRFFAPLLRIPAKLWRKVSIGWFSWGPVAAKYGIDNASSRVVHCALPTQSRIQAAKLQRERHPSDGEHICRSRFLTLCCGVPDYVRESCLP